MVMRSCFSACMVAWYCVVWCGVVHVRCVVKCYLRINMNKINIPNRSLLSHSAMLTGYQLKEGRM
jgi:hypothetical protein